MPAAKSTTARTEPTVEETPAVEPAAAPVDPTACVVPNGRHVGRAVNGRVCSAHAISHHPDGTPRRTT